MEPLAFLVVPFQHVAISCPGKLTSISCAQRGAEEHCNMQMLSLVERPRSATAGTDASNGRSQIEAALPPSTDAHGPAASQAAPDAISAQPAPSQHPARDNASSAKPPAAAAPTPPPQPSPAAAPSRHTSGRASAAGEAPAENAKTIRTSVAELASAVDSKHARFVADFEARASKLSLVQTLYTGGNIVGCLQALKRSADVVLAVDILRLLCEPSVQTHYSLEMCGPAVSVIYPCLRTSVEGITATGLAFLGLILKGFGPRIMDGLGGRAADPRDLEAAERQGRLKEAKAALVSLDKAVEDVLRRNFSSGVQRKASAALDMLKML